MLLQERLILVAIAAAVGLVIGLLKNIVWSFLSGERGGGAFMDRLKIVEAAVSEIKMAQAAFIERTKYLEKTLDVISGDIKKISDTITFFNKR